VLPSPLLGFCDVVKSLDTTLRTNVTLLSVTKNVSLDSLRAALIAIYTPGELVLFEGGSQYYALITTGRDADVSKQPMDKIITRLQEKVGGLEPRRYSQLMISNIAQLAQTGILFTYECDKPETLTALYNTIGKEAISRGAAHLFMGTDMQRTGRITVLVDVPITSTDSVIPGCQMLELYSFQRH
jgi:hypothetical protein